VSIVDIERVAVAARPRRIPLRRPTAARYWLGGVMVVLLAVETVRYLAMMVVSPRAVPSHFGATDALGVAAALGAAVLITLALAFLTTLLGAPIALVFGLLAARNLTNPVVSNVIKGVMAVIRAVPTVLWVLIFAIGAGLGAVAAVIGMSFHTVAHLIKSYSESFEEVDGGVIDALRASGASWPTVVAQAVIPSSLTAILSWTFIRFEINFGVAVAMGAAAGAGGVGFNLFMSAGFFFDIREVGFITYAILAVALVMEMFATRLNRRLAVAT